MCTQIMESHRSRSRSWEAVFTWGKTLKLTVILWLYRYLYSAWSIPRCFLWTHWWSQSKKKNFPFRSSRHGQAYQGPKLNRHIITFIHSAFSFSSMSSWHTYWAVLLCWVQWEIWGHGQDTTATLASYVFPLDVHKEPECLKLAAGSEKETEL